jgi:hypothetical protein
MSAISGYIPNFISSPAAQAAEMGKNSFLFGARLLAQASPYFSPMRLAQQVKVLPTSLALNIPFFTWISGSPKEGKAEDLLSFYDEARLKQELSEELGALLGDATGAQLLYEHLRQAAGQKDIALTGEPSLHATPFVYKVDHPEIMPRSESFFIPKDIDRRFDGYTYYFEGKKIKASREADLENRKHLQQFCIDFHARLHEKAPPQLRPLINMHIGAILAKALRYACLDGLGADVAAESCQLIAMPQGSPLADKVMIGLCPDQKKSYIHFELEDNGNLNIAFTMVNVLTIQKAEDELDIHRSIFHTCAVIKVSLNLLDDNFADKKETHAQMTTFPYVPVPKPKV